MIVALLPAAGKSQRMGRPKLALPLGLGDHATVLEHVVDALKQGGVAHILVVLAPHVAELAELAARAGAAVCLLDHETPDMRATVEEGLRWFEQRLPMCDDDGWLLCPADHPAIDAGVIARLELEKASHPERSILIPTFEGRRGHPALIGWKEVAAIRALPPGQGLNSYFRLHASQTLEVPVESPGVLLDLDTPEDYVRLQAELTTESQRTERRQQ
jgi:molybdenum cofactor cytidylyltransferase